MKIFSCLLSCSACISQLPAEEPEARGEPSQIVSPDAIQRIDGLRQKALQFVTSNIPFRQEVLNDILERSEDPAFLANPTLYVEKWIDTSGATEEHRYVEDMSRLFFERVVLLGVEEQPVSGLKLRAIQFVAKGDEIEKGSEMLIIDEIFSRLEDPSFSADPEKYLADWTEKRGFSREFRIPEDTARIFFDQIVSPIAVYKLQAAEFVQTNSIVEEGTEKELLDEIFKRLIDPAFLANPEKYLADWSEKRGKTREYRFPEDTARVFFHQIVYQNT